MLPKGQIERNINKYASLDLGRGCPFECSFCTIINVQGRKSRFRTVEDLDKEIRVLEKQMREAAKSLEFEKAAELRDKIKRLRAKEFGLK